MPRNGIAGSYGSSVFSFFFKKMWHICAGFPGGSDGKESACKAGDLGVIPGSRRSPGEGNGTHTQRNITQP